MMSEFFHCFFTRLRCQCSTLLAIASLCMLAFSAHAQSETPSLTPEQSAIVDWMTHEQNSLNPSIAARIVSAVYAQAQQYQLDPYVLLSIMRLESRFNPNAKSNHGALGLMQVLVKKHKKELNGRSPYSIEASVEVGAQIFAVCLEKSHGSLYKALNCYSGGGGHQYWQLYAKSAHLTQSFVIAQLFSDGPGDQITPPTQQDYDLAMK